MFETTKTSEQKKIPKEVIQYNINWKQVKFNFYEPDYTIVPSFGKSSGMQNGVPKAPVQPQVGGVAVE